MLLDEYVLARERINQQHVTTALLLQGAISSVLSTEGGKLFNKEIGKMNFHTIAFEQPKGDQKHGGGPEGR